MIDLEQKRESLQNELNKISDRLRQLQSDISSGVESPAKPRRTTRQRAGSERGALKEKILGRLSSAGQKGASVKEIADSVGSKPANIHSWFQTTGKRVSGLKKVGPGRYRYKGDGAAAAPKTSARKTAVSKGAASKAAAPKGKQPARGKPGSLSERIVRQLKKAGDEGMTVKELANKLKTTYKNVFVWFVTTGKKYPVKKIGQARYKLES